MAQVTLRRLIKKYDDTFAVRGIDLDIADKEFVCWSGRRAAARAPRCA